MKHTVTRPFVLALFLAAFLPAPAFSADMAGMDMSAHAQAEGTEAVGVVEELAASSGMVTISHEPIKSLGWPAMTMDFVCKDKKLIGKLGKGKKIHFRFVERAGNYVVTDVK